MLFKTLRAKNEAERAVLAGIATPHATPNLTPEVVAPLTQLARVGHPTLANWRVAGSDPVGYEFIQQVTVTQNS